MDAIREAPVPEAYECCFCAGTMNALSDEIGVLTLRVPQRDQEASQDMYCHATCLRKHVRSDLATLFEVLE